MLVNINPKVLSWAREERGLTSEEVIRQLGAQASGLGQWEISGQGIPFETLLLLAKIYKRQTAAFFLPDVPLITKKPNDCRNLAIVDGDFSPDTLLAIRRTNRYLQTARELFSSSYWNEQYKWIKTIGGKKENVDSETLHLRDILEAPLDEQIRLQRSDVAFRYWRKKIEEKLGIFVFQFPMPEDELDGFSYTFNEFPYAIVLNNRKAYVRKNFTLFHELSHILKHYSGICQTDFDPTSKNILQIELECNSFAGKFLVPKEHLKITESTDKIIELSDDFCVSGEVYLRRLFDERLISKDIFFELLDNVRAISRSFSRKKREGSPSMVIQSKSTRGNKFFEMVINSTATNQISFSAASDLLGLKIGSIPL